MCKFKQRLTAVIEFIKIQQPTLVILIKINIMLLLQIGLKTTQ